MSGVYVFYATLLYGEYSKAPRMSDLPDGCYVYFPRDPFKQHWYLKDMTPVFPPDVPKELKTLVLLLGI